jgi:hypothetical protein
MGVGSGDGYGDAESIDPAEAESGRTEANFEWITEWSATEQFEGFPFEKSKLVQSLHDSRFPGNLHDCCPIPSV